MRFTSKLRKVCAAAMSGLLALGLAFSMGKAPVKAEDELNMPLALNIFAFGGSSSAEKGQPVTVTGEGQYEVSFDMATDLSEEGKATGATGIKDFGAIYILDESSLTTGESPVSSCMIKYDAVIVDGTELTVTQTEPKEAVKSNGIFDTNDPLNAWDGSVVEEVTTDLNAFTVNFTTVENPQKITVRFTLSDIVMAEGGGEEKTDAPETTGATEETKAEGGDAAPAEFDASSDEYVAQMYVQVNGSWVFRNAWGEPNYGAVTGYKYANQLSDVQDTANPVPHDGEFTDVVIKGNGTYTVSLENADFTNGGGTEGTQFNLIGLSTNIPASGADTVKITDMTIQVNDSAMLKYTYPEASYDESTAKSEGYLTYLGANSYNSDICTDANAVFCDASNWPGQVSKITITFTVSGFDHDAPAGGGEETKAEDENKLDDGATKADSNNSDKKDDSKGGLPTGAIIGIIAGVVCVVVAVVVVVLKKKKK
ncbi:MAG: hypothetical protein NC223_02025 [Butyrivibrio sp.]|nr:hypothetical protein [Butyrivibrio sp.]